MNPKEYHKQYHAAHIEKWREYSKRDYEKRKEVIRNKRQLPEVRAKRLAYLKDWRAKNVEKRKAAMKEWAENNQEYIKEYRKAYGPRRRELYQKNKEEICAYTRKRSKLPHRRATTIAYQRRSRKENIQFALKDRLRVAMGRALRRQWARKSARTFDLIGCTPEFLKSHIESLFVAGMSWENRRLWHVDHKKPLDSFDLRDPIQQRLAFHYTNLQPLWAKDNQQKSNKIPDTLRCPVTYGNKETGKH